MNNCFYILDTETTGLSPTNNSLIEIAAIKANCSEIIDRFHTFVNPGYHIPDEITELTGIRDEDVADAPDVIDAVTALHNFIDTSLPVVGHNIKFDLSFLKPAFIIAGFDAKFRSVDTRQVAKDMFPDMPDYRLGTLVKELNLSNHPQSHRAMDDVMDTYALLLACAEERIRREGNLEGLLDKPKRKKKTQKRITSSSITPTVNEIPQDNPLYGKHVVFTGELSIPRADAAQMVVNCGGVVRPSVSSKTNYLVVGGQDNRVVGLHGTSSKERKAAAMNAEGMTNIVFLREAEFLKLIPPECICTKEDE